MQEKERLDAKMAVLYELRFEFMNANKKEFSADEIVSMIDEFALNNIAKE